MSDYLPLPHASKSFTKDLKIEEAKVEYLPPEILIEIVLRLPIKSIVTWTSVSKSWNSIIKNPNFISTHLNHTIQSYNHNATPLRLIRKLVEDKKQVYALHWDNEAFDEYRRFDFPFHDRYRSIYVIGTCNGLVCLRNPYNFLVCNSCIRKYVTLPTPNVTYEPFGLGSTYEAYIGFGFDSKTNDYKLVRVVTFVEKGDWGKCPRTDVYSLATGKWKTITALPPTCATREPAIQNRAAFVNGAFHWPLQRRTSARYHNFVLVFDLGDEDFGKIMLPKDLVTEDDSFRLSVSVCGESLAAFCIMNTFCCIDVWVMKEYGVLESWTKVLTVDSLGTEVEVSRIFDVLSDEENELNEVGFRKSGEVVIETEVGKLVSIDYESKKIKDLRIPGHRVEFGDPYVESLVLLEKSEDAVSF